MRRRCLIWVAMLTAALCHGADAQAHKFSWGYRAGYRAMHGGGHFGFFSSGRSFRYAYSYGLGPVRYPGYWSYYRPYVIHRAFPLVIPAERIFGPAPAARMLGAGDALARPLRPIGPLVPDPQAKIVGKPKAKQRVSNAPTRERAWSFIKFGDRHFARGDYLQAYQRYKLAVRTAPDVVEGYLRRGQALVALHSYKLAAQTFKQAFKLHPAWSQTDFRLDAIYADRPQSKSDHLDALAAAAEEEPTADLMLLIGAQLYYDGQPDRSLKFFRRAGELNRGEFIVLPPADAPPDKEAGEPKPPPKQKAPKKPAVF